MVTIVNINSSKILYKNNFMTWEKMKTISIVSKLGKYTFGFDEARRTPHLVMIADTNNIGE